MNTIIKNEQLNISKEAREYILSYSKESIREIISHLEKYYFHLMK